MQNKKKSYKNGNKLAKKRDNGRAYVEQLININYYSFWKKLIEKKA